MRKRGWYLACCRKTTSCYLKHFPASLTRNYHQVLYTRCKNWTVANLVTRLSYLQCSERLSLPSKAVLFSVLKSLDWWRRCSALRSAARSSVTTRVGTDTIRQKWGKCREPKPEPPRITDQEQEEGNTRSRDNKISNPNPITGREWPRSLPRRWSTPVMIIPEWSWLLTQERSLGYIRHAHYHVDRFDSRIA